MNSTDFVTGPGGTRSKNIVQHVCELIPTVTLFPETTPTSATSPSHIPSTVNAYNAQPSSTHQYSNSYSSSLNSYASSVNSRVQDYPPVPPQQTFSSPQSQSYPSYGLPQATTPYGYSSTIPLNQHNPGSTSTPQHGYGQQANYANAQRYQSEGPAGNVRYFDGATAPSQQDLRHPQSWR